MTKKIRFTTRISHLLKEKSEFFKILLAIVSTVFPLFQRAKSLPPLPNDFRDKPIWWLIQNYMFLCQVYLSVTHNCYIITDPSQKVYWTSLWNFLVAKIYTYLHYLHCFSKFWRTFIFLVRLKELFYKTNTLCCQQYIRLA